MRRIRSLAALAIFLAAGPCRPAAPAEPSPLGAGAVTATSSIRFVVRIPPTLWMRLIDHPAEVELTAGDISRGELVVHGPRLEVRSNHRLGYLLLASVQGEAFTGVEIDGLPVRVVSRGAASGPRQPSQVGAPAPAPYALEYRLRLSINARPGRYAWPVTLVLADP